jgi:hypothetical protein
VSGSSTAEINFFSPVDLMLDRLHFSRLLEHGGNRLELALILLESLDLIRLVLVHEGELGDLGAELGDEGHLSRVLLLEASDVGLLDRAHLVVHQDGAPAELDAAGLLVLELLLCGPQLLKEILEVAVLALPELLKLGDLEVLDLAAVLLDDDVVLVVDLVDLVDVLESRIDLLLAQLADEPEAVELDPRQMVRGVDLGKLDGLAKKDGELLGIEVIVVVHILADVGLAHSERAVVLLAGRRHGCLKVCLLRINS